MYLQLSLRRWRKTGIYEVSFKPYYIIILTNVFRFVDEGHTAWYMGHDVNDARISIPLDIQKSSSWYLFHQALYHMYCHHDADGYATWTQVIEGLKFWVLIRPKGYKDFQTRRELFEACQEYFDTVNEKGFYGKDSERYIIYGKPGDIMLVFFEKNLFFCFKIQFFFSFQHPGCLHEVYTPIPSVVRGGHFYTYSSLHLTEVSRAIDYHSNDSLSNQSHPSTPLTIVQMMKALQFYKDFCENCYFYFMNYSYYLH